MMRTLPLTFLLALPALAQDKEHDLHLAAAKGTSLIISRATTQSQLIDMGGNEMEQGSTTVIATRFTVREVDGDGNLTVEAKVLRVAGKFVIPMMGDFAYDSIDNKPGDGSKPGDSGAAPAGEEGGFGMPDFDAIGKAAASFAGTTLLAHVDRAGKVTKLEGADEAIAAVQKRAGNTGAQMLSGTFSTHALEDLVRSAFGERPAKPLAVGATWEREEGKMRENGPPTATKLVLKLVAANEKSFEVDGEGTVTKPDAPEAGKDGEKKGEGTDDEEAAMVKEMMAKVKVQNGKVKGHAVVSREDGFVVEANSEVAMDMTMPGPFGDDMSIKVKSSIKTTRTTEEAAMARQAKEAKTEGGK